MAAARLGAAQIHAWSDELMGHVRPTGQLLVSGFLTAESEQVWRPLPEPACLVEYEDAWVAEVIERPRSQ